MKALFTVFQLSLLAAVGCAAAAAAAVPVDEEEEEELQQQHHRSLIMGGTRAANLEFPFFVQSNRATCGGSLVAKDVVVSAAHCAGEFSGAVLVGAWLRNRTANTAQWRRVLGRMVIHPRYNWGLDQNDYMLFKIEPVTNPALVPIELNTDPDIPRAGDQFTVVGMGYNSSNFTSPDRLLKVPVRYVEHDLCEGQWNLTDDYYYYNETKEVFEESMICAIGDVALTKGPTSGDSGGPVFDAATNRLVGIVSWGGPYPDKSATPFYPSVFSRVSSAADWMMETICKLTSDPESLPFACPSFRCPVDEQILGFPQATIPSRIDSVQSDFPFTNAVQSPPNGSLVDANTTTLVTISAKNALSDADVSCAFHITVGPVEYLGGTFFAVNRTNVKTRLRKSLAHIDSLNHFPLARGYLHKVILELDSNLLGGRAKMSSQVASGTNDTRTLSVHLNSTNVVLPGASLKRKYDAVVYLYGQKMY